MENTKEQQFLDERGVLVTNARFVANGQTFPIAGISSIKSTTIKKKSNLSLYIGMIIFGLSALGSFIQIFFNVVIGLFSLTVSALLLYYCYKTAKQRKDSYVVMIRTAGGETEAYSHSDKDLVDQVIKALNLAIIARG